MACNITPRHPLTRIVPLLFVLTPLFPLTAQANDGSNPCKGNSGNGKIRTVGAAGADFKTIPEALGAAMPGETVLVKAGKYRGGIAFPRSGAAGACITLKGEPGAEISGGNFGISIPSKNFISIQNLKISGISGGGMPTGIKVSGSASHIELKNNVVKQVTSSSNAHGISFYGTSSTPMSDLLIDGNEVANCRLGQSEALVINGNVKGFLIQKNKVHDNDNIGIDIIGYEGQGPSGQDFARDGRVLNNTVYNNSSGKNSTYGGERSAGGIYVDGGRGIRIEGNKVSNCDIGIELASEHAGKSTTGIIVKGNQLSGSYQGNLMMGGYARNKGSATNIVVEGNSFSNARDGEVILQYNTNGVSIKGNTFNAKPGVKNIVATGSNNLNPLIEGNTYARKPTGSDLAAKDGTFKMLVEGRR